MTDWEEPVYEDAEPATPCFELALAIDPQRPFPADATLLFEGTSTQEVPFSAGVDGGDGYLSFRFEGIDPTYRYAIRYRDGQREGTFFEQVRLGDLFRDAEGPTEATVLAVRVVDAAGGVVEISAGSLGGHALVNGDALPDWGVTLSDIPAGDHALKVTAGQESEVALTVTGEGAERGLTFSGERPPAAYLARLRAGRSGDWSVVFYLLTLVQEVQAGLFAPCEQYGTGQDANYFSLVCKNLKTYYERKGYGRCELVDVTEGCSWERIIAHLEQAAKDGVRYSRFVTVGHGGWDGPMVHGDGYMLQISKRENPETFQRFADALKAATTPDAKLLFSNCHSAGCNASEVREREQWVKDEQQRKADAEARIKKLEQEIADKGSTEARAQALAEARDEQQSASWNIESYAFDRDYRWADDLARRTGRFAAGTMGMTSTSYTMQHVKAVLEGVGITKQEMWAADPVAGKVYKFKPSGALRNAEVLDMEGVTPQPATDEGGAAGPLPLGLPSMLLVPGAPRTQGAR